MRAIVQIIKLEILSALRSKVMLLFAAACLLFMLLGKFMLWSDGTESGAFQLSVRYLFGIVYCVVLVSLGAAAAGAISTDRAAKRLQLSMIRPVRHWVIAVSRIIAISAVGSIMMAFAAIILYVSVGRGRVCDKVYSPVLESPRAEAQRIFDDLIAKDAAFKNEVSRIGTHEVMKYLQSHVRDSYQGVAPGGKAQWDFSNVPDIEGPVKVRVRLIDLAGRPGEAIGVFSFRGMEGSLNDVVKTRAYVLLNSRNGAHLPAESSLVFQSKTSSSLNIQVRRDLHLLVPADSFGWNLFRAWFMLVFSIVIVVSLGVFLGSCLGRGVAVFSLLSLLSAMVTAPVAMEEYPDPLDSNAVSRISLRLTEYTSMLTSSLNRYAPIASLEDEEYIHWREVAASAATAGVYALAFSLLAGFVMAKKQD